MRKTKQGDVIDHIDPKNSDLICGLDVRINQIVLDAKTNIRKNNRFVPYMVDPDMAVHQEFGDWGIFLIQDKWQWCEFGGSEWWAESKRLGFSSTKANKKNVELKLNIHAPGMQSANGKKAVELKLGIHAPGMQSAAGKIGGKIGGKISSAITNAQQYQCLVTGHISTPGPLSHYQRARGIDTKLRVKLS